MVGPSSSPEAISGVAELLAQVTSLQQECEMKQEMSLTMLPPWLGLDVGLKPD